MSQYVGNPVEMLLVPDTIGDGSVCVKLALCDTKVLGGQYENVRSSSREQ